MTTIFTCYSFHIMKPFLILFTIAILLCGTFITYLITTNNKDVQSMHSELETEILLPNVEDRQDKNQSIDASSTPESILSNDRENETEPKQSPTSVVQEEAKSTTVTQSATLPHNEVVQETINELTSERQVGSDIVVGYIWRSNITSPKFKSVRLPIWDISALDKEYRIDIWNGDSFIFYQNAKPLADEVFFPEGGVNQFRVTGIDPMYGICPADRSRFTWGVTFVTNGIFEGERIPITIDGSVNSMNCRVVR